VVNWGLQSILLNNMSNAGNLIVAVNASDGSLHTHVNNFTIPIMLVCWLVMSFSVIIALLRRKLPWELFAATHFALLIVVLAAELHAWSHWYHTIGVLALYALDKSYRLSRGVCASAAQLTQLSTDVTLVQALLPSSSLLPSPGGFFLLCIPSVSATEWHPFTCSSFETDGAQHRASFSIKSMGNNTWTSRLLSLSQEESSAAVHLEGPYGGLGLSPHFRHIVTVAGGIGVTPFAALLHALLEELEDPTDDGKESASVNAGSASLLSAPQRGLTFIWTVRHAELFGSFADIICAVMDAVEEGALSCHVDFHLHYTGMKIRVEECSEWQAVKAGKCSIGSATRVAELATQGRPDVAFEALDSSFVTEPEKTLVLACGPQTLIDSVSDVAREQEWNFIPEHFSL
jgi:NAD(P)H-flavin reductase